MKSYRNRFAALALALVLVPGAMAQDPAPADPEATQPRAAKPSEEVRFGSSYTLNAGERADDVVVISGSASIAGTVEGDVVVILGSLMLAGTAIVEGDTVVVGGSVSADPGSTVDGDLVVVGGSLRAPPDFSPGGEKVIIGSPVDVGWVTPAWPWLSRGPLMGRPVVPELPWMWIFLALLALVYLGANVVFERPVRECADALSAKPLTCCLVGGMVVLLAGPVSFTLLVSVIGLVILPFLWFALFCAAIVGKVGVARWIGRRIIAEELPGDRLQSARSVGIGIAVIFAAYMIPVLGIATWGVLSVVALGAVSTTFASRLRRENQGGQANVTLRVAPVVGPDAGPGANAAADAAEASDSAAVLEGPSAVAGMDAAGSLALASFSSRIGAVALDCVPVIAIGAALGLDGGAILFTFWAYNVGMWAWQSTTVGGMICRIRIVRGDGADLAPADALVRGVASIFSAVFVGLGWFWAAWDERRQSWHDRAAGSLVVRVAPDLAPQPRPSSSAAAD